MISKVASCVGTAVRRIIDPHVALPQRRDPRGPLAASSPAAARPAHRRSRARPDSPTIVLLHAVGCTGMLTWFPVVAPLARALPGRGLRPALARPRHHLRELLAARLRRRRRRGDRRAGARGRRSSAGYSMGSIDRPARLAPAPRHGRRAGARAPPPTTSATQPQRAVFHSGMEISMGALRTLVEVAHRTPRRPGDRRGAELCPSRHRTSGPSRSCAAPARGRSPRPSRRSAGTTRRPWLVADRRADRRRRPAARTR